MSASCVLILSLNSLYSISVSAQWILITDPILPNADCGMAIGQYNNVITMLGGWWERFDIIEYDINENSFTKMDDALPTKQWTNYIAVIAQSQSYSQINNTIYIIDHNPFNLETFINTYNLETKQYKQNIFNQRMPQHVGIYSCLASTDDTLFITGGNNGSNVVDTFQIFSFSNYSWSTATSFAEARYYHCCMIASDKLYIIGGGYKNYYSYDIVFIESIEFISIINAHSNEWQYANPLTIATGYSRALQYGALIYVIGGKGNHQSFNKKVHIIDTATNTVSVSVDELQYRAIGITAVIVGHKLYAFGGYDIINSIYTNLWQYYELEAIMESTASMESTHISTAFMESTQKSTVSMESTQISIASTETTQISATSMQSTLSPIATSMNTDIVLQTDGYEGEVNDSVISYIIYISSCIVIVLCVSVAVVFLCFRKKRIQNAAQQDVTIVEMAQQQETVHKGIDFIEQHITDEGTSIVGATGEDDVEYIRGDASKASQSFKCVVEYERISDVLIAWNILDYVDEELLMLFKSIFKYETHRTDLKGIKKQMKQYKVLK